MIRLSLEQVRSLHSMMIESTGGESGIRDAGLLDSALNSAFQTFDSQEAYPTLEEKAARLAYSIVKNHPFVDGNKRTGLFVMLVFLEINGIQLKHSQAELITLGLGIADGSMNYAQVLEWVKLHLI